MQKLYSREFYLAAGDGTPQQLLPVGRAVARCIEVATDHANLLGFGYEHLRPLGLTWVLSRIVLEMSSYPRVNETYTVETWVDSVNRAFSNRFFRILDCRGEVCGHSRSTWVTIDIDKRTMGDLSLLPSLASAVNPAGPECPIKPCGRHRPVGPEAEVTERTFLYSDIDSNRHVNTVRYVEMLMDRWPMDFHDRNRVSRLEVSFMRECLCGERASLALLRADGAAEADIRVGSESRVHFSVLFQPCG